MASLFREDTQNMEAGGEALRGVQTADVKTVKQPVSVSAASQSWWSCDMVKTGKIKVSGSEGRESSQKASVREDTQNMEAGGDALRGVQTADVKTVKQPVCSKSELVVV